MNKKVYLIGFLIFIKIVSQKLKKCFTTSKIIKALPGYSYFCKRMIWRITMNNNKYSHLLIFAIMALAVLLNSCANSPGNQEEEQSPASIMIFAAASMTDVLAELVDSFQLTHPVKVKTSIASSGTLARQITQGGNPDVYISANRKWVDYVDSLGYILKGYRTDVARNELVLIAPSNSQLEVSSIDSTLHFHELLGDGKLSIGDPAHVPAGRYAKQSLDYFGWYNQLDNKLIPAKDARSALMVVELQEAPAGIVYRTDAKKSDKVRILNTFPEKSHESIVYVAGVCRNNDTAKAFFEYLHSGATNSIWEKYGFKR